MDINPNRPGLLTVEELLGQKDRGPQKTPREMTAEAMEGLIIGPFSVNMPDAAVIAHLEDTFVAALILLERLNPDLGAEPLLKRFTKTLPERLQQVRNGRPIGLKP